MAAKADAAAAVAATKKAAVTAARSAEATEKSVAEAKEAAEAAKKAVKLAASVATVAADAVAAAAESSSAATSSLSEQKIRPAPASTLDTGETIVRIHEAKGDGGVTKPAPPPAIVTRLGKVKHDGEVIKVETPDKHVIKLLPQSNGYVVVADAQVRGPACIATHLPRALPPRPAGPPAR